MPILHTQAHMEGLVTVLQPNIDTYAVQRFVEVLYRIYLSNRLFRLKLLGRKFNNAF